MMNRSKDFIIPSEFKPFIEENKNKIYASFKFNDLQKKFQRFAKTYSKNAFVYIVNSDKYRIYGNTISVNSNGSRSTLATPKNCQVIDLGKTAIKAILGEKAYQQINSAQQGKYVDVRNSDDSEFSLF